MKLDERIKHLTTTTDGLKGTTFGIDEKSMGMAIRAFYQYADATSSIVREYTSNCYDSHREAAMIPGMTDYELLAMGYTGDLNELRRYFVSWKTQPVQIKLIEGSSLTGSSMQIEFHDFGVGLSPHRVKTIYTKFFASTKRETNEQIGAYGLGCKSALGYCDTFLVETVFFGKKYSYVIYASGEAPECRLIEEKETDEPNGTIVRVPITETEDIYTFKRAVCRQLMYFDDLIIEGVPYFPKDPIYRGQNFVYRPDTDENLHICLGKVFYPLDTSQTDYLEYECQRLPVGLHFEIGELDVVWNRESIEYTKKTIKAINEKMDALRIEIQGLWSKKFDNITDIKTLIEAVSGLSDDTLEIDGIPIPYIDKWVDRVITYAKYPEAGQFVKENFLSAMFEVDRKIEHGKTIKKHNSYIRNIKAPILIWGGENRRVDPVLNDYIYYKKEYPHFYLVYFNPIEQTARNFANFSIQIKDENGEVAEQPWKRYPELQCIWEAIIEEAQEFFASGYEYYNQGEYPESWKDERRDIKAAEGVTSAAKVTYKPEVESYMSYLYFSTYSPYYHRDDVTKSWSNDTFHFNSLTSSTVGRWLAESLPVVVGVQEQKEEMRELVIAYKGTSNYDYHFPSSGKLQKFLRGSPLMVSVSKKNRKYLLKSQYPSILTVNEFRKILYRLMGNVRTASAMEPHSSKIPSSSSTAFSWIPEYVELYEEVTEFVNRYNHLSKNTFYSSHSKKGRTNTIIANKLRRLIAISHKYPLLTHVTHYSSKLIEEDIKEYIYGKGPINPELLSRLKKYKEKKKYELDSQPF